MRKIVIIILACILIILIGAFVFSYNKVEKEKHLESLLHTFNSQLINMEYSNAYNLYYLEKKEYEEVLNTEISGYISELCKEASENYELYKIQKLKDAGWDFAIVNETISQIEAYKQALSISQENYLNAIADYKNREFKNAQMGFMEVIEDDENYADAQDYISKLEIRETSWNENITGRNMYYNATCYDGEYLYIPFILDGVDGIYKTTAEGQVVDFFVLSSDAGALVISGVNVVGEYLYFIAGENVGNGYAFESPYCIYEMKTDGTNLQVALEGNFVDLFIAKDTVYALSREMGLVQYDRNFEEQKIINSENVVEFSTVEDGVFYTVHGDLTHDSDNTVFFYDGAESLPIATKEYMHYYRFGELFVKHWHNNSSYELLYFGNDDKEIGIRNADICKVYGMIEGKILYSCNGSLGRETLYTYQMDSKVTNQITESKKVMDFEVLSIFYEQDKMIIEMDSRLYTSDISRVHMQEIDGVKISDEKLDVNSNVVKHLKNEDIYTASPEDKVISVIYDKQNWHYKDDKLNITIEKRYVDIYDCNVYVTHIFTSDYSLFTTGNANTESLISTGIYHASSISDKYQAIYAQNTDTFLYSGNGDQGIIIRHGQVIRNQLIEDMLAYYDDGSIQIFRAGDEISPDMLLDSGVTTSFSFGPVLVEDYKVNAGCAAVRLAGRNPRSAIGYVDEGHYVMFACDGRDYEVSRGLTFIQMANLFKEEGCEIAYNLDGGMSTTVLFMGNYITNRPKYGTSEWFFYRSIAEIMYIGTSENSPIELDQYMCDYNYFVENYK